MIPPYTSPANSLEEFFVRLFTVAAVLGVIAVVFELRTMARHRKAERAEAAVAPVFREGQTRSWLRRRMT